jgi:hypothetical protein
VDDDLFVTTKHRNTGSPSRKLADLSAVLPPPAVEVSDHDEYEVDEVLDSRLHYRKLKYRVK